MSGVPVVRVRPFNHTGPGEAPSFVASSVARQIADGERSRKPLLLRIGRTDTVRDFTDVRDVARGYWLAATKGRPGEVYNLASGRGVAVGEIVDKLLALAVIPVEVTQDPARMRPADVARQVGNAAKAGRELGWHPQISLDETLRDLLDYWRAETGERNGQ